MPTFMRKHDWQLPNWLLCLYKFPLSGPFHWAHFSFSSKPLLFWLFSPSHIAYLWFQFSLKDILFWPFMFHLHHLRSFLNSITLVLAVICCWPLPRGRASSSALFCATLSAWISKVKLRLSVGDHMIGRGNPGPRGMMGAKKPHLCLLLLYLKISDFEEININTWYNGDPWCHNRLWAQKKFPPAPDL